MNHPRDIPTPASSSEAGFSLMELIVALGVMAEVIIVILLLFDVNNRVSRVQTAVTDMQQSQRVAQHEMVRFIRMAGRGGLAWEGAIEVENGVAASTYIVPGDNSSPKVLEDTDIITVRGVFSTPIFQLNTADDNHFSYDSTQRDGTVRVYAQTPVGIPQTLSELTSAPADSAIILVSQVDDAQYGVARLTGASLTQVSNGPDYVQVQFTLDQAADYEALSAGGSFPADMGSVGFIGLLEEYRYYIREAYIGDDSGGSDPTTALAPRLTRAQFHAGTDTPLTTGDLTIDIAENMMDLQVAMGLDRDDGVIDENADDTLDDWLFNHASDKPLTDQFWTVDASGDPIENTLHYLRVTTVARSGTRDPGYASPPIDSIEDRAYGPAGNGESTIPTTDVLDRQFRRRLLETLIDMRNVG